MAARGATGGAPPRFHRSFCLAAALALLTAGCSRGAGGAIATVDLSRIQAHWPMYINYSNQLQADTAAIQGSHASQKTKEAELADLQRRYVQMASEVSGALEQAAAQVAAQRHLSLVVTRQYVGYGGVDITSDVEKILKITDASTPAP
ncbi:MAG: hypothetical protein ACREM2_08245 [Vulcanimicrobiaceae bacterium]